MKKAFLAQELLPREEGILAAVSGGMDSICLLHALWKAGYRVTAAHFNHGLRGAEAEADEAFVRSFCAARAIPFRAGRGDVAAYAAEKGVGTEEAGRILRYAFLEQTRRETGARVIATAHHALDNAETVLFHLARGTGLAGLAGIAPSRDHIVRPLLRVTREEIRRYAEENGLSWCEDATNSDTDYTRNYIRAEILPRMERVNSAAVRHIGETAERVRAENDFLDSLAAGYAAAAATEGGEVKLARSAFASAPPVLHRRMFTLLLRRLGAGEKDFTAEHYEALEELVRGSGRKMLVLPHGVRAERNGEALRLFFAPERPEPVFLLPGETVRWGRFALTLTPARPGQRPPRDALALAHLRFPLEVGAWSARERMTPAGQSSPRSLKRLFTDSGIDPQRREETPVVRCGGKPAAVCGLGADRAFSAGNQDQTFFLTWKIIG